MKLVKIGEYYINPRNITHFIKQRNISPGNVGTLIIHFNSGEQPLHIEYLGDEEALVQQIEEALS